MKTFKNIATLACSAVVAFGLMACHSNEAGNGGTSTSTVTKTDIPVKTTNTLVVNLSRALAAGETLTYNGVTGVVSNNGGTTIVFENVSDGRTLKLSGGTLIPQSTIINFGDRNVVAIDLDVVNESADYDWSTYTDGQDAEAEDELDGATASITVKANSVSSTVKGKKFSITLYTPAVSPLTDIKKGAGEAALLAAKCYPDGQTFNPAVSFEANLPGATGCSIYCMNAASYKFPASAAATDATKLTADLTKFYAVHEIPMKYNITSIEDSKIVLAEGEVPAGTNAVTYNENYGFESNATGIIPRLFRQLFGTSTKGTASKKIEIKAEGNSTYIINQKVKNIVIKSGSTEFQVKIYGEVTADVTTVYQVTPTGEVTPEEPEIVPTHEGGGSQQPY